MNPDQVVAVLLEIADLRVARDHLLTVLGERDREIVALHAEIDRLHNEAGN